MAEKIVKDSQGLAKELVNDCISRQAAITQLSHNKNKGDDEWELAVQNDIQTIWKLPSAQPETHDKRTEMHACDLIDRQPSSSCDHENDTISRRMAIDAIFGRSHEIIKMRIGNLPSAQPERKRGKWIYGEDEYGIDGYHCDKCGFFVPWDYVHKFINYIEDYNFCPNCGADMRGEQDERDS